MLFKTATMAVPSRGHDLAQPVTVGASLERHAGRLHHVERRLNVGLAPTPFSDAATLSAFR